MEFKKDTKNGGSQNDQGDDLGVCRDFQRGSCNRQNCKYRHEKSIDFCREFQRFSCQRFECRYLHGTAEEEAEYKKSGVLPPRLKQELDFHARPPVCKQFLNDTCRLDRCKYRHLTRDQYMYEKRREENYKMHQQEWCDDKPPFMYSNKRPFRDDFGDADYYPTPYKRHDNGDFMKEYFTEKNNRNSEIISQLNARILVLEDENRLNFKQLAEFRKKNSELLATNEFLLDQNAQLRMLTKNSGNSIPDPPSTANQIVRTLASVPVSLTAVSSGSQVSIGSVTITHPVTAVSLAGPTAQGIIVHSQPFLGQPSTQRTSQAQLAFATQTINTLAVPRPPNAIQLAAAPSIVTYPLLGPNVIAPPR